jgi:prevent-host-death family protein
MITKNISLAKSQLSHLVNSALQGEDVVLCKDGIPVVRLVPIRPLSGEDPCRVIPDLVLSVGQEAMEPLDQDDWEALGE